MSLSFTADTSAFNDKLKRIREMLTDSQVQKFMLIVALKARTILVNATPKGRTGNTQAAWQMPVAKDAASVEIKNASPVAIFLNEGTGASTGGFIYPTHGEFLYFQNEEGQLIRKRRVRGIQPPRKFIDNAMPDVSQTFKDDVNQLARRLANA